MLRKLNPNISTDCVVFTYEPDRQLRVLLVERELRLPENERLLVHDLKLPGGLVYNDELLKDAATRTLKELSGLEGINLEQFEVLDSLERMDNKLDRLWLEYTSGLVIERVVSIAFYGIIHYSEMNPVALNPNAKWVEIDNTQKLPFDHNLIISKALHSIRKRLIKDGVIFSLLPEKFTINQLQNAFQAFYDRKIDSRNFRKKLKKLEYIIPLDEKQLNVAHKPAVLFKFDKKRFQHFGKNKITL